MLSLGAAAGAAEPVAPAAGAVASGAAAAPASAEPVLLFDEAHHNVQTADGRYAPFTDLARALGIRVQPQRAPFAAGDLTVISLVAIVNPRGAGREASLAERARPAFTAAEIAAVGAWVENGGGLLLIADHAPIGSACRTLAARFGVDLGDSFTEDAAHSVGAPGNLEFSRSNGLLGTHAILEGATAEDRVRRVRTFTGESLLGPPGSTVLLRLADSAVDRDADGRSRSAAGRAQGLAFELGRGRVVVLGEAAMLTEQTDESGTYGFDDPAFDNRRLARNILAWLLRRLP